MARGAWLPVTLYDVVLGNPLCRWRLALQAAAICRAHGIDWQDPLEYPADADGTGIYVVADGEPVGWVALEDLLWSLPWAT